MWLKNKPVDRESSGFRYKLLDQNESQSNEYIDEELFPASDTMRSPCDLFNVSIPSKSNYNYIQNDCLNYRLVFELRT